MIVLMASMAPLTSAAAGSKSKPLTHTPRQHQKWEPRNRQYNANLTNNHNHPFTSVDKDNVPRQAFHMGLPLSLMVRVTDPHNSTKANQDLWIMRRLACSPIDAYMVTSTADTLEHERAHIPQLPHGVQPSKDASAKAMDNSTTNEVEPDLTASECRILTFPLL